MAANARPTPVRLPAGLEALLSYRAQQLHVAKAELVRRFVEIGLGVDVQGEVERQTRKDIDALVSKHPMGEALAAVAHRLAREIDYGNPFALPQLSKELRGTLAELAQDEDSDDDDDVFSEVFNTSDDDPTDTWS